MIKGPLTRTLVFSFAASGVLSLSAPARAEMPVTPRKPAAAAAKSAAGVGAARFDWLAKRASAEAVDKRVVHKASLGHGSWICSPAGFNQKSRCFRR